MLVLSSEPFNSGSLKALAHIRQRVGLGLYKIIGMGYLDEKPAYFGDHQTFFIQIALGFGLFLFHPKIPPEAIRARIQTDIAVTKFLEQKRITSLLHPIVEPVKILTCGGGDAPYVCKSIPGKAGFPFPKEDIHATNVFKLFERFVTDNLSDMRISATQTTYDIHSDNVILNDIFIRLIESTRSIANQIHEWSFLPECDNERKALADEWAARGARIYLFDFGTWILPV